MTGTSRGRSPGEEEKEKARSLLHAEAGYQSGASRSVEVSGRAARRCLEPYFPVGQ